MSTIALHSPLNIWEGLVPKDHNRKCSME